MNDQEFVAGIWKEVLDANCRIYRRLFAETQPGAVTDQYWQEALRFYDTLDDAQREALFEIVRQVMVDTISNLFGVLDGTTRLEWQLGTPVLELNGQMLNGSLQDQFLEMEEHRASE